MPLTAAMHKSERVPLRVALERDQVLAEMLYTCIHSEGVSTICGHTNLPRLSFLTARVSNTSRGTQSHQRQIPAPALKLRLAVLLAEPAKISPRSLGIKGYNRKLGAAARQITAQQGEKILGELASMLSRGSASLSALSKPAT